MNTKKEKFLQFLSSIGFTSIHDTDYTWVGLSEQFDTPPSTLRGWAKEYLNNNKEKKVVVKSWEMLTKDGVVTLHSYKHERDFLKEIEEIVSNIDPLKIEKITTIEEKDYSDISTAYVFIGDVHIGMEIENSLFGYEWNEKVLFDRGKKVIEEAFRLKREGVHKIGLVIGGDVVDGQDGQTTRKRHELPQNMSNREQIDVAVRFISSLVASLLQWFKVDVHFICNSNHGGILEYAIARITQQMFKEACNEFIVTTDFIHVIQDTPFLVTHGYDEKMMNKGFSRFLTEPQKALIKKKAKAEQISKPVVVRFDLHQYHDVLYDDLRDILVPSFAPPSSYISYNFGADYPGGFIISVGNLFRLIEFD